MLMCVATWMPGCQTWWLHWRAGATIWYLVNPRVLKSGHSFKKGFHCLFAMCRGFGGSSFWPLVSFLFGLGMLISAAYWLLGYLHILHFQTLRLEILHQILHYIFTSYSLSLSQGEGQGFGRMPGPEMPSSRGQCENQNSVVEWLVWKEVACARMYIYIYVFIHICAVRTYVRTYIHVNHER